MLGIQIDVVNRNNNLQTIQLDYNGSHYNLISNNHIAHYDNNFPSIVPANAANLDEIKELEIDFKHTTISTE